jgi:hypothetical protein
MFVETCHTCRPESGFIKQYPVTSAAMKRPKKPFIVEFKQARRVRTKLQPSIWAAVDMSGSSVELNRGATTMNPQGSSKPAAALDTPELTNIQRILPTLARAPASDVMEILSSIGFPSEREDDAEETDQASVSVALATELVEVPVEGPKPRLRRQKSEVLPAGQRWKRRLPRILRQDKSA